MRILLIDNYDSFTYNLYHYLEPMVEEVVVQRNDELELDEIEAFTHLVLSPGPGLPSEAGICQATIERFALRKPILGICLGFQALAQWSGDQLYNQESVTHGLQRRCTLVNESTLFEDLPERIQVGLYHSWAVKLEPTSPFRPIAHLENGTLMAMEHHSLPLAGVQFHPESILTEYGREILSNWLKSSARFIAQNHPHPGVSLT